MSLELKASNFHNHTNDKGYASIRAGWYTQPALYANYWTDKQHYVCQYDCE